MPSVVVGGGTDDEDEDEDDGRVPDAVEVRWLLALPRLALGGVAGGATAGGRGCGADILVWLSSVSRDASSRWKGVNAVDNVSHVAECIECIGQCVARC